MIQDGARIDFDVRRPQLREEWEHERLNPMTRVLVITAAMLLHEQGAVRVRIVKLFGDAGADLMKPAIPEDYGLCAAISVLGITEPSKKAGGSQQMQRESRMARWVTDRLNILFPFGPSDRRAAMYGKETGLYDRILLEVPASGFKASDKPLSEWMVYGAAGRYQSPRELRI
jgi:hypothetical protein